MDYSMQQNVYGQQQQQHYPTRAYVYPVQHSAGQMYQAGWGVPMGGAMGSPFGNPQYQVPQYHNNLYRPMVAGGQEYAMDINPYLPNHPYQGAPPSRPYQGQAFSTPSQAPQGYQAQWRGAAPPQQAVRQPYAQYPQGQGFEQAPPQRPLPQNVGSQYPAQWTPEQYQRMAASGPQAPSQVLPPQQPAAPYMQPASQFAGARQVQGNQRASQTPIQEAAPQIEHNREPTAAASSPAALPQAAASSPPAAHSPAAPAPSPTPTPAPSAPVQLTNSIARPIKAKKQQRKKRAPSNPKPAKVNKISSEELQKRAVKAAIRNHTIAVAPTPASHAAVNYALRGSKFGWENSSTAVLPSVRDPSRKRARSAGDGDEEPPRPAKAARGESVDRAGSKIFIDLTADEKARVNPIPVNPNKQKVKNEYMVKHLPILDTSEKDAKNAAEAAKKALLAEAAKKKAEEDEVARKIEKEAAAAKKKEEKRIETNRKQAESRAEKKRQAERERVEREERENMEALEKELEEELERELEEEALAKELEEELENELEKGNVADLFGDEEATFGEGELEIDFGTGFATYDTQVDIDAAEDNGYASDESTEE